MKQFKSLGLALILLSVSLGYLICQPGVSAETPYAQSLLPDGEIVCEALTYPVNADADLCLGLVNQFVDASVKENFVYWGCATSTTSGTFGIADVVVSLSDIQGTQADYYDITICNVMGRFEGPAGSFNLYGGADLQDFAGFQQGVSFLVGESRVTQMYDSTQIPGIYTEWPNDDVYNYTSMSLDLDFADSDRPFTASEINSMYLIFEMYFTPQAWTAMNTVGADSPLSIYLTELFIIATPVYDYTPPVYSSSFIIRPNGEVTNSGMNFYPGTEDGTFDAVNDTQYFGDADVSYMNCSWSYSNYVSLTFDDAPSYVSDNRLYAIDLWVIARETVSSSGRVLFLLSTDAEGILYYTEPLGQYYTNVSDDWLYHNGTGEGFTVAEINHLTLRIGPWFIPGETPGSGQFLVTQIGIMCRPVSYIEDDGGDSPGFGDVVYWLGKQNGILAIFGVMGFLGMIGIPVITYLSYRNEGGFNAVLSGVMLFMLFFIFFIVAVFAARASALPFG